MCNAQDFKIRRRRPRLLCRPSGFTLIEVLVAMVLVSMVTVVAAMALRLAIGAWERGEKEGEQKQILMALPGLLTLQLASLEREAKFSKGAKAEALRFCGEKEGFSLFTSYAPLGSPSQGLLRVTWRYERTLQELLIYQQVVTRAADMATAADPMDDEWDGSIQPVSQIPGVKSFELSYAGDQAPDPDEMDSWEAPWPCGTAPRWLSVEIAMAGEKGEGGHFWRFPVGVAGL